jgi:hypothetical protein
MARCTYTESPFSSLWPALSPFLKTDLLRVSLASALIITFFGACSSEYDGDKVNNDLHAVKNDAASVEKLDRMLQSHADISGENAYHFYSHLYESALKTPYPYFLIIQQKRRSAEVVYEALRNGGAMYEDYRGRIPEDLKKLKARLLERLFAAGVPQGEELRSFVAEYDRGSVAK